MDQIRLVPVEFLQQSVEKVDNQDDSDIQSISSEEYTTPQVLHVVHNPPRRAPVVAVTLEGVPSTADPNPKKVNCLFCYNPVNKFVANKPCNRRILSNTAHRLFKYICNHLDIEAPNVRFLGRNKDKAPKESLLIPACLPLCTKCRELYYNSIYESFVTYEDAVLKLTDQIAACVTRTIGISAARNKNSVGYDNNGSSGGGVVEDIFDAYEQSMNEHDVMRSVRDFRQRVVEKNPAGYIEETSTESGSPSKTRRAQAQSGVQNVKPGPSTEATVTSVAGPSLVNVGTAQLTNVIKIVKNRSDLSKKPQEAVTNRLEAVKREMNDANEGIETIDEDCSKTDLNYYAVSNPAPGVINIIPIAVGGKGQRMPGSSKKKRKRSDREDFQKQKIAMNTCKFCNKYFPGTIPLITHQVQMHGMEKPEKCPKCDYRGISKGSLKSHMNSHLDGEDKERIKRFFCHVCSVKFHTKNGLTNHLRSHTGEKPYVCEVCSKAFTSSTSMKLCMDKHKGIKHHKCAHCDKTFLRREVLKIHERTHTGEKPFKCHICGKAFAQRSPLNVHLKMHKRKDPASYVPKPKKR